MIVALCSVAGIMRGSASDTLDDRMLPQTLTVQRHAGCHLTRQCLLSIAVVLSICCAVTFGKEATPYLNGVLTLPVVRYACNIRLDVAGGFQRVHQILNFIVEIDKFLFLLKSFAANQHGL